MQGLPCLLSWKFWKVLDVVCFLLKSVTYSLKLSRLEEELVAELSFEHANFFVLSVLVESIFSVILFESSSDEFQSIAWDCEFLKYYVLWYIEVNGLSWNLASDKQMPIIQDCLLPERCCVWRYIRYMLVILSWILNRAILIQHRLG